jgi:hypothetical protein
MGKIVVYRTLELRGQVRSLYFSSTPIYPYVLCGFHLSRKTVFRIYASDKRRGAVRALPGPDQEGGCEGHGEGQGRDVPLLQVK